MASEPLLNETSSLGSSGRDFRIRISPLNISTARQNRFSGHAGISMKRIFVFLLTGFTFGVLICLIFFSYFGDRLLSISSPVIGHSIGWSLPRNVAEQYAEASSKIGSNKFRPKSFSSRNLSFDRIHDALKLLNNQSKNGGGQQDSSSATFNFYAADVIVFLHIQKTAGTMFERWLTRNLDVDIPCNCMRGRKKCKCTKPPPGELLNPLFSSDHDGLLLDTGGGAGFDDGAMGAQTNPGRGAEWLFSRYSTGWSCGLHADWTELVTSNCVDNVLDHREKVSRKRRYFYTTFLREPVSRYISEFRHVQRGATWAGALHVCNGRRPTPQELPNCYNPNEGTWEDVTLTEFLDCPFNLAHNRQTRMLADLRLVNCYNTTTMSSQQRDTIMLASAKSNLASMAYYGLQDLISESEYLFEQTFRLQFTTPMRHANNVTSKSSDTKLTKRQLQRVKQRNSLDIELYKFARELLLERFQAVKSTDPEFETNFHQG